MALLANMEFRTLISHVSFLVEKSIGIWFVFWAIRRKADVDYKLSGTAKTVRWTVVGAGYVLGAGLPGPAVTRVVPGLTGICFLCWPNLAYHLSNLFVQWPTTEGRVGSVVHDGSHSLISYNFEVGQDTFGGATSVKSNDAIRYSEGHRVMVAYDLSTLTSPRSYQPLPSDGDNWRNVTSPLTAPRLTLRSRRLRPRSLVALGGTAEATHFRSEERACCRTGCLHVGAGFHS